MNDFYLIEYQAKANYQLSTVHLLIFSKGKNRKI